MYGFSSTTQLSTVQLAVKQNLKFCQFNFQIERLKRKNRKLEAENEEFTAANLTFDIKEVNNLRAQVKSLEGQKQHITDSYRTNINEFRDACYLLFGFKVDKQHGNIYR